jgi:y4mF family transcriptional regulator
MAPAPFADMRLPIARKLPEREQMRLTTCEPLRNSRSVSNLLKCAKLCNNIPLGKMDSGELGLIVRRERKAQKLKQAELAAVSGVGIRFIVDLEAGKPTLQLEKVLRVVRTLGCEIQITPPANKS